SDCVLLYRAPLSSLAKERLAIIRKTTDGFEIAQRDLELRGPGELLGTQQAGVAELRIADLARDRAVLPMVAKLATDLLDNFPEAIEPTVKRWLSNALDYGDV
ncbi:MAG: ATP-dependent DNA helicase RecG, partial [Acidobacteria bacterium]|nr:ATP-dependent DNA helicase RecG [Acidobacteriota bacterium]